MKKNERVYKDINQQTIVSANESHHMAGGCLCVRLKQEQTHTLGYEAIASSSE